MENSTFTHIYGLISILISGIGLWLTLKSPKGDIFYITLLSLIVVILIIFVLYAFLRRLDKLIKTISSLEKDLNTEKSKNSEQLTEYKKLLDISSYIAGRAISLEATPRKTSNRKSSGN